MVTTVRPPRPGTTMACHPPGVFVTPVHERCRGKVLPGRYPCECECHLQGERKAAGGSGT